MDTLWASSKATAALPCFQSDELNINRNYSYYKEDEVVNIKLDVDDIVSKVEFYFNNLEKLYDLAEKGRKKTQSYCLT